MLVNKKFSLAELSHYGSSTGQLDLVSIVSLTSTQLVGIIQRTVQELDINGW